MSSQYSIKCTATSNERMILGTKERLMTSCHACMQCAFVHDDTVPNDGVGMGSTVNKPFDTVPTCKGV